jgi:hypothetical protein
VNSHEILKQLNRLLNNRNIDKRTRMIIQQTIQHIKIQGDELQTLRDDITDLKIPREDKG